jgi:hypothetical protein
MGEVDRFDPVQANREFTSWPRSSSRTEHLVSTQEATGSIPVGASASSHASIAQLDRAPVCDAGGVRFDSSWAHRPWRHGSAVEQLSHKQFRVCSTHTPVTNGKEVVLVKRQTQIRVARRPRRSVIVFRFRGRVFSLARRRVSRSGGQRHHFLRRVAQSGQRTRFGTARSKVRILPRRLLCLVGQ